MQVLKINKQKIEEENLTDDWQIGNNPMSSMKQWLNDWIGLFLNTNIVSILR